MIIHLTVFGFLNRIVPTGAYFADQNSTVSQLLRNSTEFREGREEYRRFFFGADGQLSDALLIMVNDVPVRKEEREKQTLQDGDEVFIMYLDTTGG